MCLLQATPLKSFSVATQETAPRGIRFKSDGTKMYIVGTSSGAVHQYSLSTGLGCIYSVL